MGTGLVLFMIFSDLWEGVGGGEFSSAHTQEVVVAIN